MFGIAQLASRRGEGRAAIALLVGLMASLIAYKTGPALRTIQTAQSTGQLKPRSYLVNSSLSAKPGVLWTESSAYFRIIWPALAFGILISAAARMVIRQDWFAPAFTGSGVWSTFSEAVVIP